MWKKDLEELLSEWWDKRKTWQAIAGFEDGRVPVSQGMWAASSRLEKAQKKGLTLRTSIDPCENLHVSSVRPILDFWCPQL